MQPDSDPVWLVPGIEYENRASVEPGPIPRPVDLFGDAVQDFVQRTSKRELLNWRTRLLQQGIGPGDFLTRVMADAYLAGETQRVIECATVLLPYTLPKLNAVMVAPGGGAPGQAGVAGGVLRFSWAPAETIDNNNA